MYASEIRLVILIASISCALGIIIAYKIGKFKLAGQMWLKTVILIGIIPIILFMFYDLLPVTIAKNLTENHNEMIRYIIFALISLIISFIVQMIIGKKSDSCNDNI